MADIADRAEVAETQDRDDALDAHRARVALEERIAAANRPRVPDAERCCVECGELIGVERLRLLPFAGRCAQCAAEHEKQMRMRGVWHG
jgi:RNA polymerase-binding transcription factor DksA